MNPHRLEVADVIRMHGAGYLETYGGSTFAEQRRVLRNIVACRTATLGGHKFRCNQCGHMEIAYNSCRDRHCPKCQAAARAQWLEARADELLPVPYFHLVFTLPPSIASIALQNKRVVYGILFRAASRTLLRIADDPKHLGAKIGFLAVLHTWGQNLMHHPHVHCVVPGGGLSPDGSAWIPSREDFFLPVRVLSKVFRGKFIILIRKAYRHGQLTFHGKLTELSQSDRFDQEITKAVNRDWVVYAKRPFGGPEQVLKYLARYTHRVAISNHRLISMENDTVTFRWKNYTVGDRKAEMALGGTEFIRRFLLHVLPSGFMRIRHFGLLANRSRRAKLEQCRQALAVKHDQFIKQAICIKEHGESRETPQKEISCPVCKKGQLMIVEVFPRPRTFAHRSMGMSIKIPRPDLWWDTS